MLVKEKLIASGIDILYENKDYRYILQKTRDYVHNNYVLLTHPLSGSVKPNETPFKSIAVEKCENLCLDSLDIIEKSILTFDKFFEIKNTPNWNKKILDDFRVIDLDLIKNALVK